MWHKYVSVAVANYNTSSHASLGCEPCRGFHGRIPYDNLDKELEVRPQQAPISTSQVAQDVLDQTEMIYQDVRKNAMQAYIKYKGITKKRPTLQISKKEIMCMSYSRNQIIKAVKNRLHNFGELALILLKRGYLTKTTCYAKVAPTNRKCFTACDCVS